MKKIKIFFFIILVSFSYAPYLAADKEGLEDLSFLNVKNSNFKKGNDIFKQALKYKNKNKIKKANKRFEKALDYFILANRETPNNIEILKLLGFSYYMVGDPIMSEIFYQEGLEIDPKNDYINQKLGELYFNTNRIDLAKDRLNVLKNCNCEEYLQLKKIITK